MAAVPTEVVGVLAAIEGSDRFLVQQVFKPMANEYRISVPAPGSVEEGEPLLFVKQKRMKVKEDIRFRPRPDDGPHVFMIKSKTVFEFRGRHEVLDAEERVIGGLGKLFARSLLRSHWQVVDSGGNELFQAHEASWFVALLRRFADLGPDWIGAADVAAVQLRADPRRPAGSQLQARARQAARPLHARDRPRHAGR